MSIAQKTFPLYPFRSTPPAEFDINGTINRQLHMIEISFKLHGDLKIVSIPPPARHPSRRDRLWEHTCLECFMASEASPIYWEFNFSPAGHWNAYRFNGYRQGMQTETAIRDLVVNTHREPNRLYLGCRIDLYDLGRDRETLIVGLAAVLRNAAGRKTYWAASHPGSQPDFHRRDSFILITTPQKPEGDNAGKRS